MFQRSRGTFCVFLNVLIFYILLFERVTLRASTSHSLKTLFLSSLSFFSILTVDEGGAKRRERGER
jgi:hypothetical protein